MANNSAYIQISQYALLEYQYNSEVIPLSAAPGSAGAQRLENKYMGTYQFLNTNQSVDITGNVLDRSAGRKGPNTNRWAYFDIDSSVPVFQTDSNYVLTNQTGNLSSLAGKYDLVRLHILSGFEFPGLDGVLLQVQWKQWSLNSSQGNTLFDACNHVYLKGQEQINFNSTPLFLGDRLYDRYIDVKVPSLYDVNQDFWNSPTASNTIGYNYTVQNVGFLQNSQILFTLFEIDSSEAVNGNLELLTGNSYRAAVNPADNYSQLGLVIEENSENDYIEYYPTWNGGFLETYINDLNSVGGDWVVINQIDLYEQVGTSLLRTSNMTMLQDNKFDQPAIFRPVILNSSVAFSYTIDYTMRFFNRADNSEILRKSSFTSMDVKKYGRQLEKINVLQGFSPVKVYNKIVQMQPSDTEMLLGLSVPKKVITQKIITPVFYESNSVSVDSTTKLNATLGETVYSQGLNVIYLSKFDNLIKFKIFTLSGDKQQNVSLDMSTFIGNVVLSFNASGNNQLDVPSYFDINLADPAIGEVAFRIDTDTATKILASADKNYFIINQTNPETVIYSGTFDAVENRVKVGELNKRDMLTSLDQQITQKSKQVVELDESIANLRSQVIVPATSTSTATAQLTASQQSTTAPAAQAQTNGTFFQNALAAALQAAAASGVLPNIVELPGATNSGGYSVQANIRPLVQRPARPNSGSNPANNPTTQGNTTQ